MHLTITFLNGQRVEAVVLAISADRMRISTPGCGDAMELRAQQGVWITESGEPVEIESMIADETLRGLFMEIQPAGRGKVGRAIV